MLELIPVVFAYIYELSNIYILLKTSEYKNKYINIDFIIILLSILFVKSTTLKTQWSILILILIILFKICFCYIKINFNLFAKNKYIFIFLISFFVLLIGFTLYGKLNINSNLIEINNTEVNNILNSEENKKTILYVGRPNCTSCEVFQPQFEGMLKKYNIKANYYNTAIGREEDETLLEKNAEVLGIQKVPSVIFLEGEEIIATFSGDNIKSNVENFIQENNL